MSEIIPNQQNLIIYPTFDGKVSVTMMARDGNSILQRLCLCRQCPTIHLHFELLKM